MPICLTSSQCKYLRGQAHQLKPIVLIGQKGATPSIGLALDQALIKHELVKVKFIEGKEKSYKQRTTEDLQTSLGAQMVGMIGHTAIFYRPHPDPDKRKINLPADST